MTRYIVLAALLVSIDPLTSFWVDRELKHAHDQPGYSQEERDGMNRLWEKTLTKPGGHHKAKTGFGKRQADGLAEVYGLTAADVEKPIEIFGRE